MSEQAPGATLQEEAQYMARMDSKEAKPPPGNQAVLKLLARGGGGGAAATAAARGIGVTSEYLVVWRPGLAFLAAVVAFDSVCVGAIPTLHNVDLFGDSLKGGAGWYTTEASGAIVCAVASAGLAVALLCIPRVTAGGAGAQKPEVVRLFPVVMQLLAALVLIGATVRAVAQGKIEYSSWGAHDSAQDVTGAQLGNHSFAIATGIDSYSRLKDVSTYVIHFLIAVALAVGALYQSVDHSFHPSEPEHEPPLGA